MMLELYIPHRFCSIFLISDAKTRKGVKLPMLQCGSEQTNIKVVDLRYE